LLSVFSLFVTFSFFRSSTVFVLCARLRPFLLAFFVSRVWSVGPVCFVCLCISALCCTLFFCVRFRLFAFRFILFFCRASCLDYLFPFRLCFLVLFASCLLLIALCLSFEEGGAAEQRQYIALLILSSGFLLGVVPSSCGRRRFVRLVSLFGCVLVMRVCLGLSFCASRLPFACSGFFCAYFLCWLSCVISFFFAFCSLVCSCFLSRVCRFFGLFSVASLRAPVSVPSPVVSSGVSCFGFHYVVCGPFFDVLVFFLSGVFCCLFLRVCTLRFFSLTVWYLFVELLCRVGRHLRCSLLGRATVFCVIGVLL